MNEYYSKELMEALAAYDFGGQIAGALPYGCGHINDTYALYVQKLDGEAKRYILQKINTTVFKNPIELMSNIVGVTEYLKNIIRENGGDEFRETLNVVKTKRGQWYFTDSTGGFWRVYLFVEGTLNLQIVEKPQDFYQTGKTFGRFTRRLNDYPAGKLYETIKDFHNTKKRFDDFVKAVKQDTRGRAKNVESEIAFVLEREKACGKIVGLLQAGKLPVRVTHNDTKLNNILIDKATGQGLCVIDLDTIMPGTILYDFGDSIRFGASTAPEDETDLSKVNFSLELYDVCKQGYLDGLNGSLKKEEIDLLPFGARLMTLECGMRFLADYLEGDVYFKTNRESHNLDRARTQFKLVQDMEKVFSYTD